LRVYRSTLHATGACTFIIDKWYLQLNATTSPATAWVSSKTLYNRYDPVATSATTQQYINYLDVWGIPGDAPAVVRQKLTGVTIASAGNPQMVAIGRTLSGDYDAATFTHWLEAEDATTGGMGITWSTPSDANRSGGAYLRATDSGVGVGTGSFSFTGAAAIKLASQPWQVYAIIRASDTGVVFALTNGSVSAGFNVESVGSVSPSTANQWEAVYLGTINATGQVVGNAPSVPTANILLHFAVSTAAVGGTPTGDIDAFCLIPAQQQDTNILLETNFQSGTWDPPSGSAILYIDGYTRQAYLNQLLTAVPNRLGGLWTLQPGEFAQRLIMATFTDTYVTGGWTLLDTWTVELAVTARTRHLLGTI
jgi:hypothetical protein